MPANLSAFGGLNIWAMLKSLVNNQVGILTHDDAPDDGASGTYAGLAGKGSLLIDYTNGTLYQNTGTKAEPTWTQIS